MTETEEEDDDWFRLKQLLAKLVLRDIKQEWEFGYIPSIDKKLHDISLNVMGVLRDSFLYLKERGDIYILPNKENNNGIIIEMEMLKQLGINFDQDQKEW